MVIDEQTLEEIQEYILERLPRVLEQDPRFATFIEGILAEKFPRRDEFAQLLEEVRQHRAETQRRFEQAEESLHEFREETNQRFEQVDETIREFREETHQRFEQVDETIHEFREETNQRFEQVDETIREFREETNQRFEQVDQRFEQVDDTIRGLREEVHTGFEEVYRQIDRLGARWGIRNEKVFRQAMKALLEGSFDVQVKERHISGEQFDVAIYNGDHILIEITASVKRNIRKRLERKRQLYIDETGVTPSRFLLVVGSISSSRAEKLRAAGFEVIEPELDENEEEVLPL